jgi:TonB family protein
VTVHAVLITMAVIATNPPDGLVTGLYSLANKVIYLAPPVRVPHSEGSVQQLKYTEAAPVGEGAGVAPANKPAADPVETKRLQFTTQPGDAGTEQKQAADIRPFPTYDSVFTVTEVDSAARIDASSAAPEYPPELLKEGIEGRALVRYVVDSLGRPDISTFRVVSATRPEFAEAVHDALPRMIFVPARMGDRHVAQLVEQPFGFRLQHPDTTAADRKKPPA